MYPRLGLKTAITNYADGWGEKYTLVNEIVTTTNGETLHATIYVHMKHE